MIINIIVLIIIIFLLAYVINKLIKTRTFKLKDTLFYLVFGIANILFFINLSLKVNGNSKFLDCLYYVFTQTSRMITLTVRKDLIDAVSNYDTFTIINFALLYIFPYISIVYVAILSSRIFIGNCLRRTTLNKIYVLGYNSLSKEFIKNSSEHNKEIVVVLKDEETNNEISRELYNDKIKFISSSDVYKTLLKKAINKNQYNHIVSFYENNDDILAFINFCINNIDKTTQYIVYTEQKQIKSYVETLLAKELSSDISSGLVRVCYKHEMIGYDLIRNNDIAKYMPRELIKDNFTLDECKINLFFIGFGKSNAEVFDKVVANSQFVTLNNGYLQRKNMNIHIFDKNIKYANSTISNGLFKYKKSNFALEKYYELPEDIVSQTTLHFDTDVNSMNLINDIYDIVNDKIPYTTVNYFFVSLGDDLENNVFAKKLKHNLELIDYTSNVYYVRCKHDLSFDKDFVYYGVDKNILSYDSIINDNVVIHSKLEAMIYNGDDVSDIDINTLEGKVKLNKEWGKLSRLKQNSNIEAILSRYFKLSLMGLDENVSRSDYLKVYDPNNDLEKEYVIKDLSKESNPTVREVFSFMEHLRWNYFQLSEGVLPRKKEKAFTLDGFKPKSSNELEHLCITTQKGLYDYYCDVKRYNEINNTIYTDDVIRYDYDIMDKYKIK